MINGTNEKIMEFITRFIDEHGYSPSLREIMDGCNMSTISLVVYHLNKLVAESKIKRNKKISRSVVIL